MADLRQLRADLAAFAAAIGRALTDWEVAALRLDRRTTTIVAPRQTGKSRALAVLALWQAFRLPAQVVLIVSAGEDASRRLLAEAAAVGGRRNVTVGRHRVLRTQPGCPIA